MEREILLVVGRYALVINRNKYLTDYIVASGYNTDSQDWGSGTYFSASTNSQMENAECLMKATEYFYSKVNKAYISRARLEEIATRFKDALMEFEDDESTLVENLNYEYDLALENEELEFFGLN